MNVFGRGLSRQRQVGVFGAGVASAIILALVVAPDTEAEGRSRAAGTTAVFTRSLSDPWTADKGSDFEAIVSLASGRLHTPISGQGRVILSVTLDYRSSQGDWGLVSAGIRRAGSRRGTAMRPGGFRVASSNRTTTTLTWVKKGLVHGSDYIVELSVRARDGDGDATATVVGRKFTFAARAS